MSQMLGANNDHLTNMFDALLVKQDVNIMLLADPGNGITTSTNDVGMMHGFNVTPDLSVFCFILQLLNMIKECLLSFFTVTIWTVHVLKTFYS